MQTPRPIDASKPITTLDGLKSHLYQAAQVEMSTIPLYLYAAYSIRDQSYSQWSPGMSAFRTIRSIVIEEMLHLALVRNMMIAVGGGEELRFYHEAFLPAYPTPMLHRIPTLELVLAPCGTDLMREVFMPLELPAETDAPPEPDQYNTLGQFYAAIALGFERLAGPELFARNRADLQLVGGYYNQDGGGSPFLVCDLVSALGAITTIVEQGEGAPNMTVPLNPIDPQPGQVELSHYAKFKAIADDIDAIGHVWPVPTNPKTSQYPPKVAALSNLFNAGYCYLLCMIDAMFGTSSKDEGPARWGLQRSYLSAMQGILYPLADLLVRQEIDGGHAAPTFEYFAFDAGVPRKDQLLAACDALLADYPELGGDNSVRWSIELMPSV